MRIESMKAKNVFLLIETRGQRSNRNIQSGSGDVKSSSLRKIILRGEGKVTPKKNRKIENNKQRLKSATWLKLWVELSFEGEE